MRCQSCKKHIWFFERFVLSFNTGRKPVDIHYHLDCYNFQTINHPEELERIRNAKVMGDA